MSNISIRFDWTRDELRAIHDLPLLELVHRAATVHRAGHDPREVQVCRLISIKTGGCPEDCGYCSQSAHYETGIASQPLLDRATVVAIAERAKANGVSRICMGAAWRNVRDDDQFEAVLDMVRGVNALGVEVCCTLGMLTEAQARRLEAAGLHAYNHNLDTSREHYGQITTTRAYDDRLETLANVRKTNVTLCTGGILGLGESVADRIGLLHTLATMQPHPESVPVNILTRVPGTPLESQADVSVWETVRVIATARIAMPRSIIRLSAGRTQLSEEAQAMCFLAGANSIFSSDAKIMLTEASPTNDYAEDTRLLATLGLYPRVPFKAPASKEPVDGEPFGCAAAAATLG
ncbi:MAG: biotin synthase BioB [Chloracidobacterium sp.]|uniref:Biotin synthase n=1 Tax=Chloracidobacterium validum TaxID=2821543 RepID=A0ABX8B7C5_9BACT|nr:biotin synthase BioB [Chloracidobacterium validum]QUW02342.1 biotin synthase BioB [Chloracidobacterium validum]